MSTQRCINVHVRLSVRHKICHFNTQSLTTVAKMVGKCVDQKDEIRAYIKACYKLGCSLKQLMTELSTACGASGVPNDTVRRWKNNFESGVEFIKM